MNYIKEPISYSTPQSVPEINQPVQQTNESKQQTTEIPYDEYEEEEQMYQEMLDQADGEDPEYKSGYYDQGQMAISESIPSMSQNITNNYEQYINPPQYETYTPNNKLSEYRPAEEDLKITDVNDALNIEFPVHTAIIGETMSGKTNFILWFIAIKGSYFSRIIWCSPTAGLQKTKLPQNVIVIEEITKEILQSILDEQKNGSVVVSGGKQRRIRHRTLMIFDDQIGSFNMRSIMADKFFATGRQYEISCIVATQYLKHISPTVRMNCKYICITSSLTKACIDELVAVSRDIDPNKLKYLLRKGTENHKVFMFNMTSKGKKHMIVQPGICKRITLIRS